MAVVKVSVSIDEELLQRVDSYADNNGMTRSGLFTLSARQYMDAAEAAPAVTGLMSSFLKLMNDAPKMSAEELSAALDSVEADRQKLMK